MNAYQRWKLLWPVTWLLLWGYRFGMWGNQMPDGPKRRALYVPGLFAAVGASVIWNWTILTIVLMEFPRFGEWMGTKRVQRLYDTRASLSTNRLCVLIDIVTILNKYDRQHIRTMQNDNP